MKKLHADAVKKAKEDEVMSTKQNLQHDMSMVPAA